ncbi:hypothetical protein ASG01_11015 [Chryseobacterium sp. Leaf180]|uniref:hypothetical protein n=1 Tax=Chryseobacterium sp. Leaf180 TaxID=1736289 RepID=UPI0006FB4DC1|nr:hypothetical protein [Chryseobacterium sp. Leaf180]KQR92445.1 hypothetical protein ASG01_11015 [Chryseobacterium sp. Leaf180]
MESKSFWRTVLTVGLLLFALIRIAMMCGKSSYRSLDHDENYQRMVTSLQEGRRIQEKTREKASNNLFYQNYDSISKLNDSQMNFYKVMKTDKDSLLSLDLTASLKVDKNSFIQKNYDDTLNLAVKMPDNTTILMHSYEGSGDLTDNFKAVKKSRELSNIKNIIDKKDVKYISYNYLNEGIKKTGFALLTETDRYFSFIEIENSQIPKSQLEKRAMQVMMQLSK